jgi:hypothetical protein
VVARITEPNRTPPEHPACKNRKHAAEATNMADTIAGAKIKC